MADKDGAIIIELYDHEKEKQICTAKVLFGLESLIVISCDGMSKTELYSWLKARSRLPKTYDIDAIVLEKLDLSKRAYEFGRMSEACVLYAMLNHFISPMDKIAVYPLKTEYISMIDLDFRYSNIYIWNPRKELNNP